MGLWRVRKMQKRQYKRRVTQIKRGEAQEKIILHKEKETPGTWRFKENKEDHPMTIYLTKDQVKELGSSESIKVTITAT